MIRCCNESLKRLKIKVLDIYQVHWPNPVIPLKETIDALKSLYQDGKIRAVGVGNYSLREIKEVLFGDLKACNNYKGGEESLEKINCPTLCIFGDLDKMVPLKVGTHMSALIKNSETKVISNCGHMIIFEKAFEMRQLVKEFILKNKK